MSGVAGCLCLRPLFVDPYQGERGGVGWGRIGAVAVGPKLLSKSLEIRAVELGVNQGKPF